MSVRETRRTTAQDNQQPKGQVKLHLRFDDVNSVHTRATLFVNGANCGQLCLRNAEAIWLHHILNKGCSSLSPDGSNPITFVSSGKCPTDEQCPANAINEAVR